MRYQWWIGLCLLLVGLAGCFAPPNPLRTGTVRVATPAAGQYYHGVYPGGTDGEEDDITLQGLTQYESLVGAQTAWVYFSNNWYTSRQFPLATATWIRGHGSVPFIRLMLRDSPDEYFQYTVFTLQAINNGAFDTDLRAWAQSARAFGSPLIVEYGTECNGQWFGWNGKWNGANLAATAQFVAAYRHIILLMRAEGANNITWVFHVNTDDDPSDAWNQFENYYPGDDVIDWVGVSAYGAQTPQDSPPIPRLRDMLDSSYPRLQAMAPSKPVYLLEFGNCANNPYAQPDVWAQDALTDIFANRWANLAGFSWWNEHWSNDDNPADDSILDVEELPKLAQVMHQQFAGNTHLLTRPAFTATVPRYNEKLPNTPTRAKPGGIAANRFSGRRNPTPNACRTRRKR